MPAAAALPVTPDDLAELRRWARSAQLPAVLVRRARILLLAATALPTPRSPSGSASPVRP